MLMWVLFILSALLEPLWWFIPYLVIGKSNDYVSRQWGGYLEKLSNELFPKEV
jgi:hypothetical protein